MSENYDKHPHPIWAKFLDGELDLTTAFWGYLIGATVLWCFVNGLMFSFWGKGQIIVMAIGVFLICNRTWACANKYIKEKNKKNQPALWGVLTQGVCILNAISMVGVLYDVFVS